MTEPAKSSEAPAEGADTLPGRKPGSPTPAKDAPPPGSGSAAEPAVQHPADTDRRG